MTALVAVSSARMNALQAAQQPMPQPVPVRALLDTGASCTCVDPTVLQKLGLTPTGVTQVVTPSTGATAHTADQYDVAVAVPAAPGQSPLIFPAVPVVASDFSAQGIEALIGRDILGDCVFVYNGSIKMFTLAY